MGKINIAVLISGSGTNLQAIIDSVKNKNINGDLKVVISNNKNAYGLKRADKEDIKNYSINPKEYKKPEDFDKKIIEILEVEKIDLIVLAGYLKILSKYFVDKYKNKIINIHPSLIPVFCGKNFYGNKVHEEAIKYGVKISGATTHFVNEEPDGGPIIIQKAVKVDFEDTPESLQSKVLEIEHEILVETIKLYCENKLEVVGRKVKIKK